MKWGYGLSRGALRGSARRDVYLVNRNGSEVLGRASYRSLEELPGSPELVVLAVPATGFDEAVDQALAAGARAIVGITAGLGETDDEGRAREQAAAERIRASGAVLLGPNCLGVFDAAAELDIGWSELPPGEIGLISQSGNLALELALIAADHGLGFSRFASLGNQADLEAAELVTAFAAHEGTRVVALYVEDFRDGRAFAGACHAASTAGKPVVLLAAGASDAAGRAARSHTGALVSDFVAVQAACRAAGIEQVSTPRELIDTAQALLSLRPFPAAAASSSSVTVEVTPSSPPISRPPPRSSFPAPARSSPRSWPRRLGPSGITGNPVDFAGAGERSIQTFVGGGPAPPRVRRGRRRRRDRLLRRLCGVRGRLRGAGNGDRPGDGAGRARYGPAARRPDDVPPRSGGRSPPGGPDPRLRRHRRRDRRARPARRALRAGARPAFRDFPQPPRTRRARSRDRPRRAATSRRASSSKEPASRSPKRAASRRSTRHCRPPATWAIPVVLKALGLLHKSDAGGVVLGIGSEEELELVFSDMATRLSPAEYSVERTAAITDGIELIVGVRRDPRFGPIALAGTRRDLRRAPRGRGRRARTDRRAGGRGTPALAARGAAPRRRAEAGLRSPSPQLPGCSRRSRRRPPPVPGDRRGRDQPAARHRRRGARPGRPDHPRRHVKGADDAR